ncbi:hypothetical protein [uncultured Friedmanniella sp.]|uniref:hypothetical protein n=1 Tax=uncultured Friedmanniella sp. TaxID=335381 RepID=UPI0035CA7C9F
MKRRQQVAQSTELGERGAWCFTLELVVEPELVLVFWELYEAAFGGLRTRSMARQVLTEEEFGAQMVNPDVRKYVAWTADGDPVGMCVVTTDLTTVPWISAEYFAARYPEHWERRAIWYITFLLAHPTQRHSRFLDHIVDVGVGELVEEGAICAYDMCAYNDAELGLSRRVAESFRRTTGAVSVPSDVQSYYTVDFSSPAAPEAADPTPASPAAARLGNEVVQIGPADAAAQRTMGTV